MDNKIKITLIICATFAVLGLFSAIAYESHVKAQAQIELYRALSK